MCTSALFTWLLSTLLLCSEAYRKAIDPDNIILNISESSDGVQVKWRNPTKGVVGLCYESKLQYKTHCEVEWKELVLRGFNYRIVTDRMRGYELRMQMRYSCLVDYPQLWSPWTPSTFWRNETGSCSTKEYSAQVYVGTILPLIICFMLIFAFQQKRIRQFFLPHIPDPKHINESYVSMDHPYWLSTFTLPSVECEMVSIETLSSLKNENEDEEEIEREEKKAEESTFIDQSAHQKDIQRYTNLEFNGPYVFL
uniref:Fibronectin type-III domain-containing protein n=1 Tax=Esox lucius TaxID=8010 RepID=A0AAY5L768_ESOLU